jgi:hypothetical protein
MVSRIKRPKGEAKPSVRRNLIQMQWSALLRLCVSATVKPA